MIYITGDKHRDFSIVDEFCYRFETTKNDILVVLGDAWLNWFLDSDDYALKDYLKTIPITFFCIHGNHEERPECIRTYKTKRFKGGIVYYEKKYPNILFAKDGEVYSFDHKKVLVIGGAYSVDKEYRLKMGYRWFETEQPKEEVKNKIKKKIKKLKKVDYVFSHTCPYSMIPVKKILKNNDYTTEYFLEYIKNNLKYEKWFCGHFHINKVYDDINFLFDKFDIL